MFSDSVIFFINLVCGKIIIKLYNMSFYYKIVVLTTIFTRLYNNKKADLLFFETWFIYNGSSSMWPIFKNINIWILIALDSKFLYLSFGGLLLSITFEWSINWSVGFNFHHNYTIETYELQNKNFKLDYGIECAFKKYEI